MKQCIAIVAILLALGTASVAWCGTVIFSSGGGDWANPNNWTPTGGPPTLTAGEVVIANTSGTVTVDQGIPGFGPSADVLNNTGTINLAVGPNGAPTLYVSTTLNNSGIINVPAGFLQIGGGPFPNLNDLQPATATGGGTINLTGGMLTISSPLTIATGGPGGGQNIESLTGTSGLITCTELVATCLTISAGNVIQANGGTLVVAANSVNNGGILQAVNGGNLQLSGGHNNQGATNLSGGTIQALDGSTVLLGYTGGSNYGNAGSIIGSTLNTSGSGVMQVSESMILDGVTNNGNLQVVNVPDVTINQNFAVLANTINNVGTITLNGGNILLSATSSPGNFTLQGGGTVNMGGYAITGQGSNGTVTNVDNLIQGAGGFGYFTLNNQTAGVINANTSGQVLSFVGGTINNSGILEASNGGTLQLAGDHNTGVTSVTGGTIQAQNGSTVLLGFTGGGDYTNVSNTVTGSTLKTTGTGVIQASEGEILTGITNQGNLNVVSVPGVSPGQNFVYLAGTINNTGTITMVNADIRLSGPVSLTGNGTVILGGGSIFVDALTSANTIEGSGYVQTLTNQGTVYVPAGDSMTIGNLTNLSGGTLTGGTYDVAGTLTIQASVVDNAATLILDGPSSSIVYGSTDALAATFADNQAGGTFEILNGRNFTTEGAFSNEGTIDVGAGSTLTIGGAFTNTGNLDINGTLDAQTIAIGSGQDLSGSGTIYGDVTVYGSTDPGNSPGILTVVGDYTQESGSFLNIQLGGTGSGEFDQLNVIGNLSLAGTLDVFLWDGFVPGNGDTFDILNWTGSRTGSFEAIDYPTLSAGYYFEPEWGDNSLTLEVGYNSTGIPEPATCFLIGAGLLVGIYGWRAKRRIG